MFISKRKLCLLTLFTSIASLLPVEESFGEGRHRVLIQYLWGAYTQEILTENEGAKLLATRKSQTKAKVLQLRPKTCSTTEIVHDGILCHVAAEKFILLIYKQASNFPSGVLCASRVVFFFARRKQSTSDARNQFCRAPTVVPLNVIDVIKDVGDRLFATRFMRCCCETSIKGFSIKKFTAGL